MTKENRIILCRPIIKDNCLELFIARQDGSCIFKRIEDFSKFIKIISKEDWKIEKHLVKVTQKDVKIGKKGIKVESF